MKDLDYYLDDVQVEYPLPRPANPSVRDWYGVSTHEGMIAYFAREEDAFRFRLDYINGLLNPVKK